MVLSESLRVRCKTPSKTSKTLSSTNILFSFAGLISKFHKVSTFGSGLEQMLGIPMALEAERKDLADRSDFTKMCLHWL